MIDFKQPYDRIEFLDFLENHFLSDFEKDIRPVTVSSMSSIRSASFLGKSKSLDLYVFEIEYEGTAERRVTLTKEAFNLLKDASIYKAIAIFKPYSGVDYRLSLMVATPIVNEKGRFTTVLSNPKRYSFFLGQNAKINTPKKFLIGKGKVSDIADLRERFSIEVVNKEFYKEISRLFIELVGGEMKNGRTKTKYEGLLRLPNVATSSQLAQEFAVRLIGRLIFCWFLREKHDSSTNSLMPKLLLSLESVIKNKDYYHSILEPIFFEVLNKPSNSRKEKFRMNEYADIPYLNGGLFSPHDDDFYSSSEVKQRENCSLVIVPDEWLTSLFTVLEQYNFTIDENTGMDEELSIDPEMLGRIFENLLAEINPETGDSARKSTGSYYTPREVVDYMIDESLLQFLMGCTEISESKLRSLISYDLDDDLVSPLTEDEVIKVIEALERLKILDPACGSGAFPISALQKIVFILQQVDPHGQLWFQAQIKNIPVELRKNLERENKEKNFDYIRKLGIIRENIYGVDIQPIATEISRLRCFLTLIVDQRVDDTKENRGIDPLPNLDFKFVTANTLLGLPSQSNTEVLSMFEDRSGIEELKEVRDEYFGVKDVIEREQLKGRFKDIQKQMALNVFKSSYTGFAELTETLMNWDPFKHQTSLWFDREWMFGVKDGFDIVIGNPPYIEFKKLDRKLKNLFSTFKSAKGKYDIFVLFFELSKELLKRGGIITFINPTSFLQKSYGEHIRKILLDNFSVVKIINFNDLQVFSDVTNYTGIFIFKAGVSESYTFEYQNFKSGLKDKESFRHALMKNETSEFKECISIRSSELSNKSWIFKNQLDNDLLSKIRDQSITLFQITESIFQGIASGKDEVFYVDEATIKNYGLEENLLKKLLKGKDIKAYHLNWSGTYVIYPYLLEEGLINEEALKNNYPNIYKYFQNNKSVLGGREYFNKSNKKWYELWNQRSYKNFMRKRIVVPEISDNNNFALTDKFFGNTKTYHILLKEPYVDQMLFVLGFLNSKLCNYYYKNITTPHAGGFFAYKTQFLKDIPIKFPEEKCVNSIITEVKNILDDKRESESVTESKVVIDRLIYDFYNLSTSEIKSIESI